MAVRLGNASIDERGKATGGEAGDQTGREVLTRDWYANNWDTVLRPINSTIAEKSAKACEAGCANNNIGYDQYQRNTLHTLAKANGYNLAKVGKCETDCSAFMTVCAIAAGVTELEYTGNAPATINMVNAFTKTGKYKALKESKYTNSSDYLQRGDILVKTGHHTAMVLSNGSKVSSSSKTTTTKTTTSNTSTKSVTKVESAEKKDDSVAGTYKTTTKLNLRTGAGKTKDIITVIPEGGTVKCYGYYSLEGSTKWLYVTYTDKSKVTHTGYCSSSYLKK